MDWQRLSATWRILFALGPLAIVVLAAAISNVASDSDPPALGCRSFPARFDGVWMVGGLHPFEFEIESSVASRVGTSPPSAVEGRWCAGWPIEVDEESFARGHVLALCDSSFRGAALDTYSDVDAGMTEMSGRYEIVSGDLCFATDDLEVLEPMREAPLLERVGKPTLVAKLLHDQRGDGLVLEGTRRCLLVRETNRGFALKRTNAWVEYRPCPNP